MDHYKQTQPEMHTKLELLHKHLDLEFISAERIRIRHEWDTDSGRVYSWNGTQDDPQVHSFIDMMVRMGYELSNYRWNPDRKRYIIILRALYYVDRKTDIQENEND